MRARVIRAHAVIYADPISFRAGDTLRLGHRDDEYVGWIWATAADGRAGWVPEEAVASDDAGHGRALRDYTARELAVEIGDEVIVDHALAGWVWVRNAHGDEGWIPESDVEPMATEGQSRQVLDA